MGSIPSCSNTATSSVSASVVTLVAAAAVVDRSGGAGTDRLVVVNASTDGAKSQTTARARVLQIILMTTMLLMEAKGEKNEGKTQRGDLVSHG
jgi:hypothetical protein